MINDILDWFKGLFGDTAGEAVQGASDTLQGAGADAGQTVGRAAESAQLFQEEALAGATEQAQAAQEQALGGAGETVQSLQEEALAGATEQAQAAQEQVLGGVGETVQSFQEQADTVSGVVENPADAAADAARDRLTGQG